MLIVFSGLPGVGKTTVARGVACRLLATYLRIDAVEEAIRSALGPTQDIGTAGYVVAQAVAETNLALGRTVVADCVNPLVESRSAWRAVASHAAARLLEVEVVCSDVTEHRRRVEARVADIAGHALPAWASITAQAYQAWDRSRLIVDTAQLTPDEGTRRVIEAAAEVKP